MSAAAAERGESVTVQASLDLAGGSAYGVVDAPRGKGELGAGDVLPPGPYIVGLTHEEDGYSGPPWTVCCNHAGKRFGRLVAVEPLGLVRGCGRLWGCVCDCGRKLGVFDRNLLRGHVISCGCRSAEIMAAAGGANKLQHGEAAQNDLFTSYKRSARKRNLAWELSKDTFLHITSRDCCYCGRPPATFRRVNATVFGGYTHNGIDRVDNSLGYTVANSAPCRWDCNRAKGALIQADFLKWIDRLAAFALLQKAGRAA